MYIDSHTHLDFFGENINKAIEDINKDKIITLANSMDIKSYELNKKFAKRSKYIKPCFGIHPWKVAEYKGDLEELIPYIEESKLIGEIGLDFFWIEDKGTYENQRKVFNFILKESIKRNKFVSVHTKGAEEEIYNILKMNNYNKAIIHWYSGEISTLEKYIELGCYFTISVDLGYSEKTNEVLDKIPLNRLLIETDGPTALEWVNGEYGYPRTIIDVAKKVSDYKNIELNKLLKNMEENYNRIIS